MQTTNTTSRRHFLRNMALGVSSLAGAGALASFGFRPQPVSPVVDRPISYAGMAVRRNIAALPPDDPSIKLLKDAIRILKERSARSPLEPSGWDAHGALHTTFCATNYYPNQVHYNWFVWPWHRLYLWSMEKKLQRAVREPKLALHYWDWTKLPRIPEHYWGKNNPLYNNTRLVMPDDEIPLDFINVGAALRAPKFFTFGGYPHVRKEGEPQIDGIAEHSFHNNIHNWIGGDMASFVGSGYDPVFYAHHGNCDRIWDAWLKYRQENQNPNDADWLEKELITTDEKGKPMTVKIRELLDTEGLGYQFEDLNLNPTFCNPYTEEMCPTVNMEKCDVQAPLAVSGASQQQVSQQIGSRDRGHVMVHFSRIQLPYMPYCARIFFRVPASGGNMLNKYVGTFTMLPIVRPDSSLLEKDVYLQIEIDRPVIQAIEDRQPIEILLEPVQLRDRPVPETKIKLENVELTMS